VFTSVKELTYTSVTDGETDDHLSTAQHYLVCMRSRGKNRYLTILLRRSIGISLPLIVVVLFT